MQEQRRASRPKTLFSNVQQKLAISNVGQMPHFDGFRSSVSSALLLLAPVKEPTKHLPTLYASFIHSRYIAFIHITVLQKSWKTDKSPGLYSKPAKIVRLSVWRCCHTPFQDQRLFVLLLVVRPCAFGKPLAGTGNFQFVQLHIHPLHTS